MQSIIYWFVKSFFLGKKQNINKYVYLKPSILKYRDLMNTSNVAQ